MSIMAELFIDVQLDLESGLDPRDIARRLDIPIHWVYEVAETLEDESTDSYDPFNTVNS
jgi:hypothetical protein